MVSYYLGSGGNKRWLLVSEDRRGESGSYGIVNYVSTLSVAEPFASLVFVLSAPQSRCTSGGPVASS